MPRIDSKHDKILQLSALQKDLAGYIEPCKNPINIREKVLGLMKFDHKEIILKVRELLNTDLPAFYEKLLQENLHPISTVITNNDKDTDDETNDEQYGNTNNEVVDEISQLTWVDREKLLEKFALWKTNQSSLTSKEKNYFFVANIINNKNLLREAAEFWCESYERYKKDSRVAKQQPKESHHTWPSKNNENIKNRGYVGMASTFILDKFRSITTLDGLNQTIKHMRVLAKKKEPYTEDDIGYILRGMMQLRDITKLEKHDPKSQASLWLQKHPNFKNRIIGEGVTESRETTPKIGSTTVNVFKKKIEELKLYEIKDPSKEDDISERHDHIQGMSGSTLDYCNWLLYMTNGDKEKVMRLFQTNYAAWHTVAPDGMAHSQNESIRLLCEMYTGCDLNNSIMTPIASSKDTESMRNFRNQNMPYIEESDSPLTIAKKP